MKKQGGMDASARTRCHSQQMAAGGCADACCAWRSGEAFRLAHTHTQWRIYIWDAIQALNTLPDVNTALYLDGVLDCFHTHPGVLWPALQQTAGHGGTQNRCSTTSHSLSTLNFSQYQVKCCHGKAAGSRLLLSSCKTCKGECGGIQRSSPDESNQHAHTYVAGRHRLPAAVTPPAAAAPVAGRAACSQQTLLCQALQRLQ